MSRKFLLKRQKMQTNWIKVVQIDKRKELRSLVMKENVFS